VLNVCGVLTMYILFLRTFDDEVKTSIMIQNFNKIINNKFEVQQSAIEKPVNLTGIDLSSQVKVRQHVVAK
jgi:hypothetical protein